MPNCKEKLPDFGSRAEREKRKRKCRLLHVQLRLWLPNPHPKTQDISNAIRFYYYKMKTFIYLYAEIELFYVGGHRDETLLGISPVGTTVAGNLGGVFSLGPTEFEVAFAAQVLVSLAMIGGQIRF